jgi:plasmid maintenance system antidote protein VapI
MKSTSDISPFKKFDPGYFITEQMKLRNWTKTYLSGLIGVNEKDLDIILENSRPIDLEVAMLLGKAFNTSSQYWINLDIKYRSWLENNKR